MKIYTTYFGNLKSLPSTIIPIAICGKSPTWFNGKQYKKLAPRYWFFAKWKENKDNNFYIKNFGEYLATLSPAIVFVELKTLSEGKDVALVCYEKPGDFCHRHLVKNWLISNNIPVVGELTY